MNSMMANREKVNKDQKNKYIKVAQEKLNKVILLLITWHRLIEEFQTATNY